METLWSKVQFMTSFLNEGMTQSGVSSFFPNDTEPNQSSTTNLDGLGAIPVYIRRVNLSIHLQNKATSIAIERYVQLGACNTKLRKGASRVADPLLYRGDCLEAFDTEFEGRDVALVVTSPPYNVNYNYGGGYNDSKPLGEYLKWLGQLAGGSYKALRPGGILAVNLPPTIRVKGEYRAYPVAAWLQTHLAGLPQWELMEPIVWVKANGDGVPLAASTAWGSAGKPYCRPTHELVIVASKRPVGITSKQGKTDVPFEWLKDVWMIKPCRAKAGHPPPFPPELVSRLVQLYSAEGDIVLDPCAGNGTTIQVAKSLNRRPWAAEIDPARWPVLERLLQDD